MTLLCVSSSIALQSRQALSLSGVGTIRLGQSDFETTERCVRLDTTVSMAFSSRVLQVSFHHRQATRIQLVRENVPPVRIVQEALRPRSRVETQACIVRPIRVGQSLYLWGTTQSAHPRRRCPVRPCVRKGRTAWVAS